MSENPLIINCSLKMESKYVYNPGFEESGSITIRVLQKTQIGETWLNPDAMIIQEIYSIHLSETISRKLSRLCSQEYADYYVESILHTFEVHPDCINWLKPIVVSAVVDKAIETKDRGLKQFELVADIVTTITEVIREREEEVDMNLMESMEEEEDLERVSSESMEEMNLNRKPASKSSIEKLKRGYFVGGVGDEELGMKCCGVCLDDFEIGSKVVWMPCSHMFHGGCLDCWLKESNSCPLCRLELND